MGIVRCAATAVVTAVVALLIQADSSALAAATWESRQVPVGIAERGDSLFGVSCPTVSFCVAVGSRGTIVTSGEPGGGPGAWRSETAQPGSYVGTALGEDRTSPGTFESVSCPTTGMCAAVTQAGDFYASANPAGGSATWRAMDLDGADDDTHIKGVSCPTVTFCAAVAAGSGQTGTDGGGKIIAIENPLAASASSSQVQLDDSLEMQAIACSSLDFCIAVANKGRIIVSLNPTAAAPTWREIGTPGGPGDLAAVDCPEASFCLAGNAGGNVLSNTDASTGAGWREVNTGPSVPIMSISCPTASRCAAVDNNGDVAISSDPTGPPGSWSATNLIPFLPSGSQGQPFNALFGVSCPSVAFCAAVGSRGTIFTSADPFDVENTHPGKRHRPRRPRMKILRSDNFVRQSRTRGAGSRVTFRLRPYGRVRGFVCSLDHRGFQRCRSPLRIYAKLGRHVLRARAIGPTGLKGSIARCRFEITKTGQPASSIHGGGRPGEELRGGAEPRGRARARARALGPRPAPRSVRADARALPGSLDF
jgi:hypothetical protein